MAQANINGRALRGPRVPAAATKSDVGRGQEEGGGVEVLIKWGRGDSFPGLMFSNRRLTKTLGRSEVTRKAVHMTTHKVTMAALTHIHLHVWEPFIHGAHSLNAWQQSYTQTHFCLWFKPHL